MDYKNVTVILLIERKRLPRVNLIEQGTMHILSLNHQHLREAKSAQTWKQVPPAQEPHPLCPQPALQFSS
jgi:hypothetical protein